MDPDKALQTVVGPDVLTKANPSAEDLLQARADVQSNPHIKDLFRKAKEEGWDREGLVDQVATAMAKIWPYGDPTEAVQYLVDEYNQLEPGIYMTDRRTGKVIAILQEDDIYQPAMVPREGGGMATPLKRIKPELEAAIHLHLHDVDREKNILATLAGKTVVTDLVKDSGDYRLLVASRKGRKHIVASLGQQAPRTLLEAAGGSTGLFLRNFWFHTTEPDLPEWAQVLSGKANARSSLRIQDPTTLNLHHNRIGNLQASLTNGWARDIARQLSLESHKNGPVAEYDFSNGSVIPGTLIIAPPEMFRAIRGRNPLTTIMPVEGSKPVSVTGHLGNLVLPAALEARNFDAFDRWEVFTEVAFSLQYAAGHLHPFTILGVEPEVQVL